MILKKDILPAVDPTVTIFPLLESKGRIFSESSIVPKKFCDKLNNYSGESEVVNINIKSISLGSDSSIVDKNINVLILFLDQGDESINTFGIRHIEGFNMDAGSRVFGKNLITGFVGKFNISAGHDDVPVGALGQIVDNTISDTFVGSCDNDVSDLIHRENSDGYLLNIIN